MSTLTKRIRKHAKIRPGLLAICILGLGALLIAPVFGEGEADQERQYILYDDISNAVRTAPETGPTPDTTPGDTMPGDTTPGDTTPGDTTPGDGHDNNGHGNNDDGVDSSNPGQGGSGHDNNGHGNNDDGVDSSNPGQGQGGPNGQVDESCDGTGDCIDDEADKGKGKGKGKK